MRKIIVAVLGLLLPVCLASYCTQHDHAQVHRRTGKKQYVCAIRPESFYAKKHKLAKKLYKNGVCTMCGCPDAAHVTIKKKS